MKRPSNPFVLVHGGWCGGWIWDEVAGSLRAQGYVVLTPTLTGLGDRANLAGPDVNLDTHIRDVTYLLEAKSLTRVMLVGHSYAGMVITGVADRMPERLSHLVYLDALVPENGESDLDILGEDIVRLFQARIGTPAVPWLLPPPVDDPKLTPHPRGTVTQPIRLTCPPASAALPRTFVHCTEESEPLWAAPIAKSAERAKRKGWRRVEIRSGHLAMKTSPAELVRIFMKLSQADGA